MALVRASELPRPRVPSWRLLVATGVPVTAWALQLVIGYGIAEIACSTGSRGEHVLGLGVGSWTLLLTVAAALATALAGVVAFAAARELASSDGEVDQRAAFMAATGLASAFFFGILIVVVGLSPLYFDACR